jgi:fumarate hydratase class II
MEQNHKTRVEHDSMGDILVPIDALYGAQTQRAINNFKISNERMPRQFIRALGLIKKAAALSNTKLGLLPKDLSKVISQAAELVISGEVDAHFPIDIYQTGSGTSSNMNCNEVITGCAFKHFSTTIHPNDHVNMSQSSNDVIPTAIHLSAALSLRENLLPSLTHLEKVINKKSRECMQITKTGRTHLMDAMPVTIGQELSAWAAQIKACRITIESVATKLECLQIGGTAVGTGINCHPKFSKVFCAKISKITKQKFTPMDNLFKGLSSQDTVVECSGNLKTLAVALMKIANDLRWMNSGPLAGLAEISLTTLQPGSSIMPGKVNPVIPEAVCMVAAQIIGNDMTITVAGQAGNFQLNVMLPIIVKNILDSINIASNACIELADKAIADFKVNIEAINEKLAKNPILITALNRIIGYELGAKIAKQSYAQNRAVIDVATELTKLSREELTKLLDPQQLTKGGIQE